MHRKKVILITGPTAVGKTSFAIEKALQLRTEIISADSRQCFKELNIGVARPSPEQLNAVKHHFIASHSIFDEMSAAIFEQYALKTLNELFRSHDTVVMVGGTGLYIKAFTEGLDAIPNVPAEIREKLSTAYEQNGLKWLQDYAKKKDPAFYASGEIDNPQRLMRAIEVMEATGTSILQFQKGNKAKREFEINYIFLELPRDQLYNNINNRVDAMMKNGLLDEVRSLLPYKHLNALQTVGYTELFDHLENQISLDKAIEKIKRNTRNYAKRQMTWFKKVNGEW